MLNFDEDFKNFTPDGSDLAAIHSNRENLKSLGINPDNDDDTVFGVKYIYCGAHRKAHATGWCTVRLALKRPLQAATKEEALAEAETLGYPTTQR
jgi:hypothetical protein